MREEIRHTTAAFKQLGRDVGVMGSSSSVSSGLGRELKPGISIGNEDLSINLAAVWADVTQNAPTA